MSPRPATRYIALSVLFTIACIAAPSGRELLAALQAGDARLAATLLLNGAPAAAIDEFGSSALMYAALYSDARTMRMLLDRDADPNHSDNAGATALMWAIPHEEKVRLLIARGAQVNVQSKLTGRTPLLVAAGRPGAASVVRLLLANGADPDARDVRGDTILIRAAYSGDPAIVRVAMEGKVDVHAKGDFGLTALLEASIQANLEMVKSLLARGADPKARDQDGFTILTSALSFHDFRLFRFLVSQGADPAARTVGGLDLMLAASSSDTSTVAVISDLVKLGLDPTAGAANLHTQHGFGQQTENAVDWSARHGDTAVSKFLLNTTRRERPRESNVAIRYLSAGTPRAAIEKALPLLTRSSREMFKRGGCAACHHQMLSALALFHASAGGIASEQDQTQRTRQELLASIRATGEGFFQDMRLPNGDITAAWLLVGLHATGHGRNRETDAVIHHLAAGQAVDGGWRLRTDRPPLESGRVSATALAIRALQVYGIPGRKTEFNKRIARARTWLQAYHPRTGEERAMRILGLKWANGSPGALHRAAAQITATQREDGGWAQLDSLPSDAYATGQALYALDIAGELAPNARARAVRFLLRTQLSDGSWHVRSRAFPLQANYFETGFPHGRDQWISAAGTNWACIGLSSALQP
jgi:ankyrin repeat protein